MRFIIILISYLKWIGLLGFPMFISDSAIWKYLWLFWLFGIVELIITPKTTIQSFGQVAGMFTVPLIYRPIPNVENYKSKIEYSLPFNGEWVVVNGGVDKNLSHSWGGKLSKICI